MSTSTTPPEPPAVQVPKDNCTINIEVLSEDTDSRRVERSYQRVIKHGEEIAFIHDGDLLVQIRDPEDIQVEKIKSIGPNVSCTDGMHIRTVDMRVIHLNLIRKWLDQGNIYVVGTRSKEYTEVKGVDY